MFFEKKHVSGKKNFQKFFTFLECKWQQTNETIFLYIKNEDSQELIN